jgi:hypothetical protein
MGKNADSDRGGKQAAALCLIACHKPSDAKPSPSVGIQKNVHSIACARPMSGVEAK